MYIYICKILHTADGHVEQIYSYSGEVIYI